MSLLPFGAIPPIKLANLDARYVNIDGDTMTGNLTLINLYTTGNVGIGTTAPGAKLDILPSSSSDVVFRTKSLQSTAPLGSELVGNGDFSTVPDTSWTWGTGWTHDTTNLEADHTTGNTAALTQNITVTSGAIYQVEFTIKNYTAGSVTLDIGGVYIYSSGSSTAFSGNTTYQRSLVAGGTSGTQTLSITPTTDFNGSVDNITVKQITGVSQANIVFLDDSESTSFEARAKAGLYNTYLGLNSGRYNTTGFNNTALGVGALYSNTTGYQNTAIGGNALYSNTTGYYNSAIGLNAGAYIADGSTPNQTSSQGLYLGAQTKALANGDVNEIVIGYNAIGNGSNSVTLGNDSITKTILKGNVGVGTTTPEKKVDVDGDIRANNYTGSDRYAFMLAR